MKKLKCWGKLVYIIRRFVSFKVFHKIFTFKQIWKFGRNLSRKFHGHVISQFRYAPVHLLVFGVYGGFFFFLGVLVFVLWLQLPAGLVALPSQHEVEGRSCRWM